MTSDQELEKLLEKKIVQGQANYKILVCRYYEAVRIGYHDPEKVAAQFDRYIKHYGMEAAEKKLTRKVFNFGVLRGHSLTKDGWTSGGVEREQAAVEALSELAELYQKLKEESKELRATTAALESCRLKQLHQTWWRDINPDHAQIDQRELALEQESRPRLSDDSVSSTEYLEQKTESHQAIDANVYGAELENIEEQVIEEIVRHDRER